MRNTFNSTVMVPKIMPMLYMNHKGKTTTWNLSIFIDRLLKSWEIIHINICLLMKLKISWYIKHYTISEQLKSTIQKHNKSRKSIREIIIITCMHSINIHADKTYWKTIKAPVKCLNTKTEWLMLILVTEYEENVSQ